VAGSGIRALPIRLFLQSVSQRPGVNPFVARLHRFWGEVSSATLQKPLAVTTWGQSGLMAAAVLEGAKIIGLSP
jgi:hypothetical protein